MDNTFRIVTQPKQNFHFRYVSELKNTHGVVTGQLQQPPAAQQHQANVEDTFPAIKLQLPANGDLDECQNKRDFYVLCTLHCYNGEELSRSLSPHLLMSKRTTKVNHNFIFAKMDDNDEDPLEKTWQLKDYVIVRLKTEEYQRSLREKRKRLQSLNLPLDFDELVGDLDIEDTARVKKNGVLNVCLGFTVFERDFYTDTYRLYRETIHSDNIFHGDDLKIHQLCNTKGSIDGGSKVHILMKLQSGYDYNVHMFRFNSKSNTIDWQETIPVVNDDIFSNAAISITLPRGPSVEDADEVEVMMEVVVGRSTYKSQFVKFWYLNNVEQAVRRKRARPAVSDPPVEASVPQAIHPLDMHFGRTIPGTHTGNVEQAVPLYDEEPSVGDILGSPFNDSPDLLFKELEFLMQSTEHLTHTERTERTERTDLYISRDKAGRTDNEKLSKRPASAIYLQVDSISHFLKKTQDAKNIPLVPHRDDQIGNTIFHDAIMDENTLVTLYRHMKRTPHKQLVLKARNNYRHNLLHYACFRNKSASLRPLVGMGCGLHEQDCQGRTPLHIAIELNHTECILKIQDLLKNHSQYTDHVETQLIQMFKVYSHPGHTVLHAAVLKNLPDLVEVMLEFCKLHKLNILQYEVLGNGDSIVHLMVQRNLVDMIDLIKKYVPFYLTVQNYPGQTVLDLKNLSLEMFEALKI